MEGLEWYSYDVNRKTKVSNAWVVTYSITYRLEGLEWHSCDVNRNTNVSQNRNCSGSNF